jgi:hypothetical protein
MSNLASEGPIDWPVGGRTEDYWQNRAETMRPVAAAQRHARQIRPGISGHRANIAATGKRKGRNGLSPTFPDDVAMLSVCRDFDMEFGF